jgi:hypothetical protein
MIDQLQLSEIGQLSPPRRRVLLTVGLVVLLPYRPCVIILALDLLALSKQLIPIFGMKRGDLTVLKCLDKDNL